MFAESLRIHGIEASLSAGLSLGEYNDLVHIGALTFEDALRILAMRDAGYEQNSRGVWLQAHTSALNQVAARYRCMLKEVAWKRPSLPYLPNAPGRFVPDPDGDDLGCLTARNICSPDLFIGARACFQQQVP